MGNQPPEQAETENHRLTKGEKRSRLAAIGGD